MDIEDVDVESTHFHYELATVECEESYWAFADTLSKYPYETEQQRKDRLLADRRYVVAATEKSRLCSLMLAPG